MKGHPATVQAEDEQDNWLNGDDLNGEDTRQDP